jgi:protein-arginine kinase activator protein McsA
MSQMEFTQWRASACEICRKSEADVGLHGVDGGRAFSIHLCEPCYIRRFKRGGTES